MINAVEAPSTRTTAATRSAFPPHPPPTASARRPPLHPASARLNPSEPVGNLSSRLSPPQPAGNLSSPPQPVGNRSSQAPTASVITLSASLCPTGAFFGTANP